MKVLIITDAWFPQVNGVVTTYTNVIAELRKLNLDVEVVHPAFFFSIPLPFYPEIKAAINPWKVIKLIKRANADYIHIATEGPLGLLARVYLAHKKIPFTSAIHTKFPEYLKTHIGFPLSITYALMRWFHSRSINVLVNTESHKSELEKRGFKNLALWSRGIDFDQFSNNNLEVHLKDYLLYVGRVSKEKNIEAFLSLKTNFDKVVVGDGPHRKKLQKKFPLVKFVGCKSGAELSAWYRNAKVFVFPSKTDTFGIVMIESLASGVPVAAYPVTGPLDIIQEGVNGSLNDDLGCAINNAMLINGLDCINSAQAYCWENVAEQFLNAINPITPATIIAKDTLIALNPCEK